MSIDLDDLDTYDTDYLREHVADPQIAAEVARRDAAEAAREWCAECWHERGTHARACSRSTTENRCDHDECLPEPDEVADEIAQRYAGGAL